MELFTRLFGNLLVLVYHCFDRIVIHGYLSGLSRPEQVVHFVRQVHGIPVVSKRCSASAPTIIRPGWRPLPAIIRSRWNGRRRVFVKKIMFCPRSAVGEAECVWSVLHLQKHGTGPDISYQHAEVPDERPQPPHLGAPAQPLYALLFLYPG